MSKKMNLSLIGQKKQLSACGPNHQPETIYANSGSKTRHNLKNVVYRSSLKSKIISKNISFFARKISYCFSISKSYSTKGALQLLPYERSKGKYSTESP